jgi:type I site-specific restriction-modification system R (restriction) subunit
VHDGAVVKLLYESRLVDVKQDQAAIDTWWQRITVGLSEAEQADLKRKYARAQLINTTDPVLQMLAYDISEHYRINWQGTPFKGQVVAAEKRAQANLIQRREETAATRSLLNTARLMEESPILIRLKELETLEKLTEKVGTVNVSGGFEGLLEKLLAPVKR